MKGLLKYPIIYIFFGFLFLFMALNFILPARTRSEIENRELASMPKMTIRSLASNSFTGQFEVYLNDHFPFRDSWITLKSVAESALFKTENNGISYGADGYMFEKSRDALIANFERNTGRVAQFLQSYPKLNATLIIVPGAEAILTDKVPAGLPVYDQERAIATAYEAVEREGGAVIDLFEELWEYRSNYIYYRTDHHWTTRGAIIAGDAFLKKAGREPISLRSLAELSAADFLGTHFNKAKSWNVRPDVITYYDLPLHEVLVDGEEKVSYYDPDTLNARDKYAAFLWGNAGLTILKKSDAEPQSRLLIIKDSYANCLAPYLALSYDEVVVVDLRSSTFKMSDYLASERFEDVLILYSFRSFGSDNNIAKLNY